MQHWLQLSERCAFYLSGLTARRSLLRTQNAHVVAEADHLVACKVRSASERKHAQLSVFVSACHSLVYGSSQVQAWALLGCRCFEEVEQTMAQN